jgi:hypothetical protein
MLTGLPAEAEQAELPGGPVRAANAQRGMSYPPTP